MQRARWLALLFLALPAVSLVAQAPKPPAEAAKLALWVGTWKYEGDVKASPLGAAAKLSGTQTGRMVMNGFFLEWKGEEKGAFGGVQWSEMDGYDPVAKNYPFTGYQNDGTTSAGANVVSGDTWKMTGTLTVKGVVYRQRATGTFSANGKTYAWTADLSTDGKTWIPWVVGKSTKAP